MTHHPYTGLTLVTTVEPLLGGHNWDQQKLSIIERVSSGQGFIIHYVGYIWDSVSVHYRGMRGVL